MVLLRMSCLASSARLDAMTRLPGCGTGPGLRRGCGISNLVCACMEIEWPLSGLSGRYQSGREWISRVEGGTSPAEDRLYVVAIRVQYEGGVVARPTKTGRTIIGPAFLQGGRVEGVDVSAVSGREGCVLLHAMWVKAVNPKDGVIDTVTDAIRPVVFGKLHHSAEAKYTQSCIVKGGGAGDVRESKPGVVNHRSVLHPSHGCRVLPV